MKEIIDNLKKSQKIPTRRIELRFLGCKPSVLAIKLRWTLVNYY